MSLLFLIFAFIFTVLKEKATILISGFIRCQKKNANFMIKVECAKIRGMLFLYGH